MTDYNDGFWHGWDGGECPVHKMSAIDVTLPNGVSYRDMPADSASWSGAMLFRVTKEHKEPLELWLGYNWQAYRSEADAADSLGGSGENPILVREVIK